MWLTEQLASRLNDWANWGLIASLAVGVISTWAVVWTSNVKEDYLRQSLSAASERAAHADERSQILERDNLKMASDLSDQMGQVAGLQKQASEAIAAQQRVELDLATQQERAAKAEEKLLAVVKRQSARFASPGSLSSALKGKLTGAIKVWYQPDDTEAYTFALSLLGEFRNAGWQVSPMPIPIPADVSMTAFMSPEYQSIGPNRVEQTMPLAYRAGGGNAELIILSRSSPDPILQVLQDALKPLGPSLGWRIAQTLPPGTFILIVGAKQ